MKNKLVMLLLILLLISIGINVFLLINRGTSNKKSSIIGIYQTQYYNNYNKSLTVTIKINENGVCKFSHFATESAGKESNCVWKRDRNKLIVDVAAEGGIDSGRVIEIEILSSGNLLYNNLELKKIG